VGCNVDNDLILWVCSEALHAKKFLLNQYERGDFLGKYDERTVKQRIDEIRGDIQKINNITLTAKQSADAKNALQA
jgi:hypothetical protein